MAMDPSLLFPVAESRFCTIPVAQITFSDQLCSSVEGSGSVPVASGPLLSRGQRCQHHQVRRPPYCSRWFRRPCRFDFCAQRLRAQNPNQLWPIRPTSIGCESLMAPERPSRVGFVEPQQKQAPGVKAFSTELFPAPRRPWSLTNSPTRVKPEGSVKACSPLEFDWHIAFQKHRFFLAHDDSCSSVMESFGRRRVRLIAVRDDSFDQKSSFAVRLKAELERGACGIYESNTDISGVSQTGAIHPSPRELVPRDVDPLRCRGRRPFAPRTRIRLCCARTSFGTGRRTHGVTPHRLGDHER